MNGPQHYREAEELLDYVCSGATRDGAPLARHEVPEYLSRAQVHATLALAAASALSTIGEYYGIPDEVEAWTQAATYMDVDPDAAELVRPIVDVHLPAMTPQDEAMEVRSAAGFPNDDEPF